jgi:hypothetical protein
VPAYRGIRAHIDLYYVLHRLRIDGKQTARNSSSVQALSQGIPVVTDRVSP